MNVAAKLQEIIILVHKKRFVPALEQMPETLVCTVEANRIKTQEPFHGIAKIGARRFNEYMEMIRHKAVGMDKEIVQLGGVFQNTQKEFVVSGRSKNLLALITPREDVIAGTRILDP